MIQFEILRKVEALEKSLLGKFSGAWSDARAQKLDNLDVQASTLAKERELLALALSLSDASRSLQQQVATQKRRLEEAALKIPLASDYTGERARRLDYLDTKASEIASKDDLMAIHTACNDSMQKVMHYSPIKRIQRGVIDTFNKEMWALKWEDIKKNPNWVGTEDWTERVTINYYKVILPYPVEPNKTMVYAKVDGAYGDYDRGHVAPFLYDARTLRLYIKDTNYPKIDPGAFSHRFFSWEVTEWR